MSDDQDKEFEQYLEGGSRLSDAYAELSREEPPGYLDYAIGDEAYRVVGAGAARGRPSARERARMAASASRSWQKWTMPLSVAATLVIVAMVSLRLPEIVGQAPMSAEPPAAAPAAAPTAASPGNMNLKQKRAASPEPQALAKPEGAAEQQDRVSGNAGVQRASPAAKQAAPAARHFEFYESGKSVPPAATLAQPRAKSATVGETAAPAAAAITSGGSVQTRDLAHIRALKRAGKLAQAKAALAAFRKRYPGYEIPGDLRDLR